jgi:hypothetical protein
MVLPYSRLIHPIFIMAETPVPTPAPAPVPVPTTYRERLGQFKILEERRYELIEVGHFLQNYS